MATPEDQDLFERVLVVLHRGGGSGSCAMATLVVSIVEYRPLELNSLRVFDSQNSALAAELLEHFLTRRHQPVLWGMVYTPAKELLGEPFTVEVED